MSPPSATRRHELLAASQAWERDQASYKPLLNATDLVFNDAGAVGNVSDSTNNDKVMIPSTRIKSGILSGVGASVGPMT